MADSLSPNSRYTVVGESGPYIEPTQLQGSPKLIITRKIERIETDHVAPNRRWNIVVYPVDYNFDKLSLQNPNLDVLSPACNVHTVNLLKLPMEEIKRQEVIFELICTEEDYISDVKLIIEVFARELEKVKWLEKSSLPILFSNLEQLLPVNQILLSRLKENRYESYGVIKNVGKIILEVIEFLKIYTIYCGNHPEATEHLKYLHKTNKDFHSFLQKKMLKPECRGLDLGSYLLKPVQRICKYPLLLKEILKYTPAMHVDYPYMVQALEMISKVVNVVNERIRFVEQSKKLCGVLNLLEFDERIQKIHLRRYLYDSNVMLLSRDIPLFETEMDPKKPNFEVPSSIPVAASKSHERWLIMLSDCLIFAKRTLLKKHLSKAKYRVKVVIPIGVGGFVNLNAQSHEIPSTSQMIAIRDVPNDDKCSHMFDIMYIDHEKSKLSKHSKFKMYRISCLTAEMKRNWLHVFAAAESSKNLLNTIVSVEPLPGKQASPLDTTPSEQSFFKMASFGNLTPTGKSDRESGASSPASARSTPNLFANLSLSREKVSSCEDLKSAHSINSSGSTSRPLSTSAVDLLSSNDSLQAKVKGKKENREGNSKARKQTKSYYPGHSSVEASSEDNGGEITFATAPGSKRIGSSGETHVCRISYASGESDQESEKEPSLPSSVLSPIRNTPILSPLFESILSDISQNKSLEVTTNVLYSPYMSPLEGSPNQYSEAEEEGQCQDTKKRKEKADEPPRRSMNRSSFRNSLNSRSQKYKDRDLLKRKRHTSRTQFKSHSTKLPNPPCAPPPLPPNPFPTERPPVAPKPYFLISQGKKPVPLPKGIAASSVEKAAPPVPPPKPLLIRKSGPQVLPKSFSYEYLQEFLQHKRLTQGTKYQ